MILDERIGLYLAKCPPAVSGSRGHDQAFTVACALVNGFALNEEDALRHFATYNAACCPPFSARECRHKVQQAAKVSHGKLRGHLLGKSQRARKEACQDVPVNLSPRKGRFRTGRTFLSDPYAYARKENVFPPIIKGGRNVASEASEQEASVESAPLVVNAGAATVSGCLLDRPEEIACSDETWQALNAHLLGGEPLVHLALSLFGPDATILSTEEGEPCAS